MRYSPVILVTMALVMLVAGCIGNDNVVIVNSNLEVTAHSLDNGNVTLTIKNNGTSEIPYVPVNVIFYDSSGKNDSVGDFVLNMKPGEEKNITVNSYGAVKDSYKIIVGDPNTNVTEDIFANNLEPLAQSYNSSKGPDTGNIPVIGTPINTVNLYDSFESYGSYSHKYDRSYTKQPLNSNATIFFYIGEGKQYVGKWVYRKTGDVVSGYKLYKDVAVIYWPEMRFAGWHRVYGPAPAATTTGGGGDIEGDDPDINAWINSLPRG